LLADHEYGDKRTPLLERLYPSRCCPRLGDGAPPHSWGGFGDAAGGAAAGGAEPQTARRRIPNVAERSGARNGNGAVKGSFKLKAGLAQMLKGGVIMDVVTPEHARIAQEAGAAAVMALERVPADIRKEGRVARMSDPEPTKST